MNADRWDRVQELFAELADASPTERAASLAAAQADADLLAEVRSLLSAHDTAGRLDRVSDQLMASHPDSWESVERIAPPDRLGPYAVLRPIAHGGMGSVYLGERADGQVRYQVAIKLLRRDLDSDEARRRFLAERQILARITHAGIARLLDAGITEEGRPWFVMEHVEGDPIDAHCDARRLTLPQRLELFRMVCTAVQHAHKNLVVHRDLKPANILVTAEGSVKLLDFGIAKALDPDAFPDAGKTETGLRLMTPEFASPEQLRGEPVTTASDVYQLGLLLYVLLTGRRPRLLGVAAPSGPTTREVTRPSLVIADTRPETVVDPAAVAQARGTSPERLRRQLAGDLDNIVLRALREEPERRYASVEQLAEDVRRHLTGLPVIARPETWSYRASKFVGRHRIGVALGGAALTVLTIAGIGLAVSRNRAVRAEAAARAEAAKSAAINEFLQRMLSSPDPSRGGRDVRVADVLDQSVGGIAAAFAGQPDVESAVRVTVGKTYRGLGLNQESDTQLREALAIRRRSLPAGAPAIAEALNELGSLLLFRGDYAAADSLIREGLEIRRAALSPVHTDLAASLDNLAAARAYQGDLAGADSLYRSALAMRVSLFGENHMDVAHTSNNLATLLFSQGKYPEAEQLFRSTLEFRRKALGDHVDVGVGINNLAMALERQDRRDDAEPLYREALALNRKVLGDEHPKVAQSLNNLGVFLMRSGRLDEAEPLLNQALAMNRRLLGVHPDIAANLQSLGNIMHRRGQYARAEALLSEAVALDRRFLGDRHHIVANTLNSLGATLTAAGRYGQAERIHREALAIQIPRFGEESWQAGLTRTLLGESLFRSGRAAEAESLVVKGFEQVRAQFGDRNTRTRESLDRVIALYETLRNPAKAAEYRGLIAPQNGAAR